MAMNVSPQEAADITSVVEGNLDFDELPRKLIDKLYEFYLPDIPYGVAKARSGDPYQWMAKRLDDLELDITTDMR